MYRLIILTAYLAVATPAMASAYGQQTASGTRSPNGQSGQPPMQNGGASSTQLGRTAATPVGEVGQRLSRSETVSSVAPMERISNRIQNRVQSRLHTRIDRNYDPRANATAPFAVAQEQTRATNGRKR